jgi:hypothetical protein
MQKGTRYQLKSDGKKGRRSKFPKKEKKKSVVETKNPDQPCFGPKPKNKKICQRAKTQ